MTSIERTAHSRLTQQPSQQEFEDNYTLTIDQLNLINQSGRGDHSGWHYYSY
jgi:hypothetical protein